MTYLPTSGLVDGLGSPLDTHFRLIAAVVIVALLAAYAVLLWAMRTDRRNASRAARPGPSRRRIEVAPPAHSHRDAA